MHEDSAKPAREVKATALIATPLRLLAHRPGQELSRTCIDLTTIDQKSMAAPRARPDVIESIMRSVAEKAKNKE
ncbi:MAG: hypothetical protein P4K98_01895 [Bryobacteraceae bacterium]|nr:hypothetical protein [Bryobacteraceae bacterium]